MPLIKVRGRIGKVYVAVPCSASSRKHPCCDGFGGQGCSDDHCSFCRTVNPEQSRNKEKTHACKILPF